jgi:alkanesulfonate monooxygenase SsuD/methylene tetrahydromethanopterin reductase-like flavin-dependent oxidoreductase (luciferase family)
MKIGILLLEEDLAAFRELAVAADEAGVASAWTIEYYNRNSFVRLTAMAMCTKRMTVGSAVTAAFARAPLMIATAIADISGLAPGRVILGLGSSTRRMNEDWYGTNAEHPAPRLEELVDLLRQLGSHTEGPFEFAGRFVQLKFAHLDKMASSAVPIYTAGVNPRMVEVAGRTGDGFIGHPIATCNYLSRIASPAIVKGAEKSGRVHTVVQRLTQVITAIDDDVAAARRRAALQVAFYSTVRTYEVIFAAHGFEEERQAIQKAFLNKDREGMVSATSDRMLSEMAVFGSQASVLEQLERYTDVADELILYPPHYGVSTGELRREQQSIIEMIGVATQSCS